MPEVPESWQAQNDKVRDAWDANAVFWDDHMGEGNDFQRLLIAPRWKSCLISSLASTSSKLPVATAISPAVSPGSAHS